MKPTYWFFPKYNRHGRLGGGNFDYLDAAVVAGVPDPRILPPSPDIVPGRKARSLAEVWGLWGLLRKQPYAGSE